MEVPLVFTSIAFLVIIIMSAAHIQQDNESYTAWTNMCASIIGLAFVTGMLIYYLMSIYPIISGR